MHIYMCIYIYIYIYIHMYMYNSVSLQQYPPALSPFVLTPSGS